MRLATFLRRDAVIADMYAKSKDQALEELAQSAAKSGLDTASVLSVLLEREALGSTAIGDGYAIPHGKIPGLASMVLLFARSRRGIDFCAPDGKECHFFFTVLAPVNSAGKPLGLLGAIARLAKDAAFTAHLSRARDASEIVSFLSAA